jgi:hypothetical protein
MAPYVIILTWTGSPRSTGSWLGGSVRSGTNQGGTHVADERHGMALVIGAVIGSIAGTAFGLLNAPQPGWRTRADLSSAAEEIGDRIAGQIAGIVAEVQAFTGTAPVPPTGPGATSPESYEFGTPWAGESVAVDPTPATRTVPTSEGVTTS